METYLTNVAAARLGAACLGVRSPWTSLAVVGANSARTTSAVAATGGADARSATFLPIPVKTPPLALMAAELLPTANDTRKQNHVHKTQTGVRGYGAMGPQPERERPA